MMKGYYVFGSRVLTHFVFWLLYYLLFGFIWAKNGNYLASYFLEFVLLPIRMLGVYFMIYTLIPKYLQKRRIKAFVLSYAGLLIVCGLLQRLFTHFFYEGFFATEPTEIFDLSLILRSIILVNSTVLFVSAIKIALLWFEEQDRHKAWVDSRETAKKDTLQIKAEKRTFRVDTDDILFIEGLGNYVTFVMKNEKIVSYISLKEALNGLPGDFKRIHKSFIVNKNHIRSYNYEDVQVGEHFIPIGRSYRSELKM